MKLIKYFKNKRFFAEMKFLGIKEGEKSIIYRRNIMCVCVCEV